MSLSAPGTAWLLPHPRQSHSSSLGNPGLSHVLSTEETPPSSLYVQLYQGKGSGSIMAPHTVHPPLLQVPGSHRGSSPRLLGKEGSRAQPADFSKPSSSQQLPQKETGEAQSPWRLQLTVSHTLLLAKTSLSKPRALILAASAEPKCSG